MRRTLIIASAAVAGLIAGATLRLVIAPADHRETDSSGRFSRLYGARAPRGAAEPLVPAPSLEDVLAARGGKRWRLAAAWLLNAGAGEMADLAANCRTERLPPDDPLWTLLMTRWAELDARGMITWARGAADYGGGALVVAAWTAWTAADPATAATRAHEENRHVQSVVLNALAAADPFAALAFARSLPEGEAALRNGRALEILAAHWPDLEQRLTNPSIRYMAKVAAVRALALTDPGRALTEAARLPVTHIYEFPLCQVMKQVAATDPEGAATAWARLPRTQVAALAALELVRAWSLRDPEKALAWARRNFSAADFDRTLPEIAAAQSSRDPAAALRLLADCQGPMSPRIGIQSSPFYLKVQDAGGFHSFGLGGGLTHAHTVAGDIALHLQGDQLVEALRPVAAPGVERMRQYGLLRPILESAAEKDPDAALAVLASGILQPQTRSHFEAGIFEKIAQNDAVFAAASLTTVDAGRDAYGSVVRGWIGGDEAAASAWVRELPPGPNRDGAASELVTALVQRPEVDYEAAFAWAGDIQGMKDRQASTDAVWIRWLRDDAAAARTALLNSGMSEEKTVALRRAASEPQQRRRN